jgi:hypothetical protein
MLRKILARLYFVCGAFCLWVGLGFAEGQFKSSLFFVFVGGWAVIGWVFSPYLFKKTLKTSHPT